MAQNNLEKNLSALSSEADFIRLAVSSENNPEINQELQSLIDSKLDWEYIRDNAIHNRITSLIYSRLKNLNTTNVPTEKLEDFEDSSQHLSFRALGLFHEMTQVLKALQEKGIEAIPYKGPTIGLRLYDNIALREFWDIDLIVKRESVLAAKAIVLALDYTPEQEMNAAEEKKFIEQDCEYNFEKGETHLEIHWRILPEFAESGLSEESLWQYRESFELAGNSVDVLKAEMLLLVLCLHGGDKHGWERMKWVIDLDRLVCKHTSLDWDVALELAAKAQATQSVLRGLYVAQDLFATPLPEKIENLFSQDLMLPIYAAIVRGRLFRPDHGLPGYDELRNYVKKSNAGKNGYLEKNGSRLYWRYLKLILTPDFRDKHALQLPRWLSFLYYLYRPTRLTSKHKGKLLKRLK